MGVYTKLFFYLTLTFVCDFVFSHSRNVNIAHGIGIQKVLFCKFILDDTPNHEYKESSL